MKHLMVVMVAAWSLGCGGSSSTPTDGTSSQGQDATASSNDASVVDQDVATQDLEVSPGDTSVAAVQDLEASPGDTPVATQDVATQDVAAQDLGGTPTPEGDAQEDALVQAPTDAVPSGDGSLLADAGDEPLPEGLYGEAPPDALPLPEFVATSHDGSTRGPDDLIGHPTVLWFFPFAGTLG